MSVGLAETTLLMLIFGIPMLLVPVVTLVLLVLVYGSLKRIEAKLDRREE